MDRGVVSMSMSDKVNLGVTPNLVCGCWYLAVDDRGLACLSMTIVRTHRVHLTYSTAQHNHEAHKAHEAYTGPLSVLPPPASCLLSPLSLSLWVCVVP